MHIQLLAFNILGAHVDHAFHPEARTDGGSGHAVLSRTGLGDDAGLAHTTSKQDLADRIVDLVGACVAQVLTLEVDPSTAQVVREPLGKRQSRWTADVVAQEAVILSLEGRILFGFLEGRMQLFKGWYKDFGDKGPAELSEIPSRVREGVRGSRFCHDFTVVSRGGKTGMAQTGCVR